MAKLVCPHCESKHVQSLPMVYASGTSNSTSIGSITALSGNVDMVSTFATTQQTTKTSNLLAQAYAPPQLDRFRSAASNYNNAKWFSFFAFLGICFAIGYTAEDGNESFDGLVYIAMSLLIVSLVGVFICYISMSQLKGKDEEAQEAFKVWQNQVVCFTCGGIFSKELS